MAYDAQNLTIESTNDMWTNIFKASSFLRANGVRARTDTEWRVVEHTERAKLNKEKLPSLKAALLNDIIVSCMCN